MNEQQVNNPGQVLNQMLVLSNNIDELTAITIELESRLQNILRDEDSEVSADECVPVPCFVPLAADINDKNDRVDAISNRLNRIISRLEL